MEKIMKSGEIFAAREGKDPIGDLKRTIEYFEGIANSRNDENRTAHLKAMADKLKGILANIEEKLENCSQTYAELQARSLQTLNVPDLQNVPYDLRAVLVHDGLIGREHTYAYLCDPASGKWFKSCDALVVEVPEATVFSDHSGLHHNAGPYFFLYSEAVPYTQNFVETPWDPSILDEARSLNEQLRAEISSENVAKELLELDRTLWEANQEPEELSDMETHNASQTTLAEDMDES